jgi:hypothetical protein
VSRRPMSLENSFVQTMIMCFPLDLDASNIMEWNYLGADNNAGTGLFRISCIYLHSVQ